MADEAPIQDPKALREFMDSPTPPPSPATGLQTLLPESARELDSIGKLVMEEARPEVPLQVNPPEGAFGEGVLGNINPWYRFQTARRKSVTDQQKYLESVFPGKVRKAKNSDDFIIEIPDPDTGKPRDVLLNEEQMTVGDFAALMGNSPELAASVLSMAGVGKIKLLTKAPQFIQTLSKLIAGSIGYKAGEAGQQIETRLEQGQAPDVLGTIGEKAKETPGQTALDIGTYGVFKAANLLRRVSKGGPGMFKRPEQVEGLPAEAALRSKFGTGISYSGAESSGMPLLAFLEAYAAAKPQATAAVQAFRDAQQNEVKALADAMTARAGTDEQAGEKLAQFLESNRKVKADALAAIQKDMTAKEQESLMRQLGKHGLPTTRLDVSAEGENLRNEVQSLWGGIKKQVRTAFQEAYAVPGATAEDVPTKPISDEIDSLLNRFSKTRDVQWLDDYRKTLNPTESYNDIVQRRSDLWDKIETSPADRETKDYVHGQLSKVMSETLDDASKNLKDPAFRKAIQKANALYKTKELPFYQHGIRDVLLKPGVPGSPENVALLERFRQSSDLYKRLTEVAGKDSAPVKLVKNGVIDGLLTDAGTSAIDPQFVDAGKLVKALDDLASNPKTRSLFDDIFGERGRSLKAQAKVLGGIQGTIPKDEAMSLLQAAPGGPTAPKASRVNLKRVLEARRQVDTVEAKRVLNAPVDDINPEKLVNSYADNLTQSELTSLATRMKNDAPALYEQMREKQIEQILGKAGTYRTWDRSKIEKVLYDPKAEPKYRALLGDRFEDVELFAKALGPIQQAAEAAEGTGMLVKGQSIGALASVFKMKPGGKRSGSTIAKVFTKALEEVPGWLGWKYVAKAIHSGAFREWASKDFPPETANLIPAALVAQPILEDIATSATSPRLVSQLYMSLRDWGNRVSKPGETQPEEAPLTGEQLKQFMRQ